MEIKLLRNLDDEICFKYLESLPFGAETLQSSLWRRVSEAEGKRVIFLAWQRGEKILALAQILEGKNFFGSFWYLPRGPVFFDSLDKDNLWQTIWQDLKREAKKEGITAIRFEPSNIEVGLINFAKKIKSIQPEQTLVLGLDLSEEKLLSAMQAKTRYNIRLAEKRGVVVEKGNLQDLNLFYRLLKITTKRDNFRGHSLEHYQKLISAGRPEIELYLAKKDGKLLAAGIFSFYGGRATYLHGASADIGRQHMAPYLLQWRMIQRAKILACRYYDFYGIDRKKWPGVTRFKLGFGGEKIRYCGTFIAVIDPCRYYLYIFSAFMHRLLRL